MHALKGKEKQINWPKKTIPCVMKLKVCKRALYWLLYFKSRDLLVAEPQAILINLKYNSTTFYTYWFIIIYTAGQIHI